MDSGVTAGRGAAQLLCWLLFCTCRRFCLLLAVKQSGLNALWDPQRLEDTSIRSVVEADVNMTTCMSGFPQPLRTRIRNRIHRTAAVFLPQVNRRSSTRS